MEAFRSILLPVPEVEGLVDPFRRTGDLVGVPDRLDEHWRLHLTVSRHESTPDEADAIMGTLRSALPIACEVGDLLRAELDGAGDFSLRPL